MARTKTAYEIIFETYIKDLESIEQLHKDLIVDDNAAIQMKLKLLSDIITTMRNVVEQ